MSVFKSGGEAPIHTGAGQSMLTYSFVRPLRQDSASCILSLFSHLTRLLPQALGDGSGSRKPAPYLPGDLCFHRGGGATAGSGANPQSRETAGAHPGSAALPVCGRAFFDWHRSTCAMTHSRHGWRKGSSHYSSQLSFITLLSLFSPNDSLWLTSSITCATNSRFITRDTFQTHDRWKSPISRHFFSKCGFTAPHKHVHKDF